MNSMWLVHGVALFFIVTLPRPGAGREVTGRPVALPDRRVAPSSRDSGKLSFPSFGGVFGLPMCRSDGVCHENATSSSPRTRYSAKDKEAYHAWRSTHKANVAAADAFNTVLTGRDPALVRDRPLVFLGDSIVETLAGNQYGQPVFRAKGCPETLAAFCDSHAFAPLVLGIAGDQAQHVLWRMDHGEVPLGRLREHPGVTFVVMVGTNNLGAGHLPVDAARGAFAVADWLLNNVKGTVVLVKLLPRGDGKDKLPRLCPPRCGPNGKPFRSFLPAVVAANIELGRLVGARR